MRNRMSKQNKEKILKSFFKLLEEKPYSEITIVDISIDASVSRKTFYRLFKNKENLLVRGEEDINNWRRRFGWKDFLGNINYFWEFFWLVL